MEESHSHLSVRHIRIYGETGWNKGNRERVEGEKGKRMGRGDPLRQMLHESLNASCSNWLYWVHQRPMWWGPNAPKCMCECLTSNTQNYGDQRIATESWSDIVNSTKAQILVYKRMAALRATARGIYDVSWKADIGDERSKWIPKTLSWSIRKKYANLKSALSCHAKLLVYRFTQNHTLVLRVTWDNQKGELGQKNSFRFNNSA